MKANNQVMVCGAASAFMNAEGMQVTFVDNMSAAVKRFFAQESSRTMGAGASRVAVAH